MTCDLHGPAPRRDGERGIALVLSLFLIMAMSVVAASVMFMAQTETYGTMNYRMMSQARYGAESGINKTVNYLLGDYVTIKSGTAGDPLSAYNMTVSPVTYMGNPVVLSAVASKTSNYPIATTVTAFNSAAQGTLTAGNPPTTVQYGAYAELASMQLIESGQVLQTWNITAVGTISGGRPATEEVRATLETQVVPNHGYSAYATATSCGAMTLKGGSGTDSYDSATYSGGGVTVPTTSPSNGDLGTNGNLQINGTGTIVNGNLYTPRLGVGNCSNSNVTAESASGGATVTGSIVQLPNAWTPPVPVITIPSPAPPTTSMSIINTTTCANLTSGGYVVAPATCSGTAGNLVIKPNGSTISWGNVAVSNGGVVTFYPGTYNFNSLSVKQNSTTLNIGDPTGVVTGLINMTLVGTDQSTTVEVSGGGNVVVPASRYSGLVINVATSNQSNNTPVNMGGNGSVTNLSYDPQLFRINYGGPNASSVSGGSAAAFMLNAPNADLTMTGGSNFYGSLLVKTLTDTGGTLLHYDKNLATFYGVAGSPLLSAFSWKRF